MEEYNMKETAKILTNRKVIISEKLQKTWAEIFKEFEGDPDFSVHRELLKDKPRKVNL
jgi:hypothetical protein